MIRAKLMSCLREGERLRREENKSTENSLEVLDRGDEYKFVLGEVKMASVAVDYPEYYESTARIIMERQRFRAQFKPAELEQRQCYQGCKQHNPHYAELCDELNYHQDCPTYKYNQGE